MTDRAAADKNGHYPSPTAEGSPLLIEARQLCIDLGYTAGGLEMLASPLQRCPDHGRDYIEKVEGKEFCVACAGQGGSGNLYAPTEDAENCGCKGFCATHGRDYIQIRDGIEYCNECAANGDAFGGELCTPCPGSCDDMGSLSERMGRNMFERQFMCPIHAAEHEAFCDECMGDRK